MEKTGKKIMIIDDDVGASESLKKLSLLSGFEVEAVQINIHLKIIESF